MSLNRRALIVAAAMSGVSVSLARASTGARVVHHGVLIRVPDFDHALTIYSERMGLAAASFWPREGFARLICNLPIYVEAVNEPRLPLPDAAHVAITFMSNELAASRALHERAGATFESDEPNKVAVGKSYRFRDALGIKHHILQPARPTPIFAEPAVYNTGFQLPKAAMPAARRLLAEAMGFKVMTEQYYPPSVPFLEATGEFGFMAHEHHPWEADFAPRQSPSLSDIGVSMVFVTTDLPAASAAARTGGAVEITQKTNRNPWRTAAFSPRQAARRSNSGRGVRASPCLPCRSLYHRAVVGAARPGGDLSETAGEGFLLLISRIDRWKGSGSTIVGAQ
ncbi:MAG: hypothetical protein HC850_14840 [Rhodomicrobium sp.]|nr:hypothetical protein [Rhodomicrobium sp.]